MNKAFKLHHIAYVVRSTDNSIKYFKNFYPNVVVYKQFLPSQNVYYTYMSNDSESYMIELIEAIEENCSVGKLLKTNDCVLYHICYYVDDFNDARRYFKEKSFFALNKPFKPVSEENIIVCHIYRPESGIIEILGKE